MRCLTGRFGVPEDPSLKGADNGSMGVSEGAAYSIIVISSFPALCGE